MKEIITDLIVRLTSRTFIILVVTIILLVQGALTIEQFLTINGVSYGGTSIKDVISNHTKPNSQKGE